MLLKLLDTDLIRRFGGYKINVSRNQGNKLLDSGKAVKIGDDSDEIIKKEEKVIISDKWVSPEENIFSEPEKIIQDINDVLFVIE